MSPSNKKNDWEQVMTAAYTDFEKGLLRYARYRVQDRSVCDDLVQDTFMKAWMYLVKTGNITLMKRFLYHVLNGLIIDEYRKHKSLSLDLLSNGGFEPGDDSTIRMIDQLDGQRAVSLIRALPPTYQQTMVLRYVKGLSLADISAQTSQTKNAVAVKLHRGTNALRSLYEFESSIRSPVTL